MQRLSNERFVSMKVARLIKYAPLFVRFYLISLRASIRTSKADNERRIELETLKCKFTLNFKASFSNGKLFELSIIALARQIGTIVARSSAERELLGLPERTSGCVPEKKGNSSFEMNKI